MTDSPQQSALPARIDRIPSTEVLARRGTAPVVDGLLDDDCWRDATWAGPFRDMVAGGPAWLHTETAVSWDADALYVAFRVAEPDVRARLVERDAKIYTENDVEYFLDGGDCYYELEVNALGTMYEAFWIWKDALRPGGRFAVPAFDPDLHPHMALAGIGPHRHPRGERLGILDWDWPGLRVAVQVGGTVNDASDTDVGWSVEIALPWAGMAVLDPDRAVPPGPGEVWRMDFSRFQHPKRAGRSPIHPAGWTLSPHGEFDSHMPERFTAVRFAP